MTNLKLIDFIVNLIAERNRLQKFHMRDMFASDNERFEKMSVYNDGLLFDYSKNRLDKKSFETLINVADKIGILQQRDAMFNGDKLNTTEERAVLHTALRNQSGKPVYLDGIDVMLEVKSVLSKMVDFTNSVRDGTYKVTGGKVKDVVNIGIGGSDLGPRMVTQSLRFFWDGPQTHFISNLDENDIKDLFDRLNPKTTLFIVASKSFTTVETMTNARLAKAWLEASVQGDSGQHFCAISTNTRATREFGIADDRVFKFWDWVGGRYSVWSAIGLSVMLAIGPSQFNEFLNGAFSADEHFRNAPIDENIPVIMAMLGIWYRNIWNLPSHAILPYDNRMAKFPAWLQQLDMESNGKSIDKNDEAITFDTGPIIFGEPGTNGQHAFYQLIHQGTIIIPCDFLLAVKSNNSARGRNPLIANCFAQSEALMKGRTYEQAKGDRHRVFEGNRPSNTFLYEELTPKTLGMLMAFYEHKVFVQGIAWNINSFDQWGVELGKELAHKILPLLTNNNPYQSINDSTAGLIKMVYKLRLKGNPPNI